MDEQELYAAVGQIVVGASALEWQVALLIALAEGRGRDRAREIAGQTGRAKELLKKRAEADPSLRPLHNDVQQLLDERGTLAHSLLFVVRQGDEDFYWAPDVGGQLYEEGHLLLMWNPRRDARIPLTLPQLRLHAQALQDAASRVAQARESLS